MKLVDAKGLDPARRRAMGKVGRQTVDCQLPESLWTVQVPELVHAKVAQAHTGRQTALDVLPRARREDDLPAMPGTADPCRAMHVDAGVVVATQRAFARMQAHPNTKGDAFRPIGRGQAPLRVDGGAHGISGAAEDREERVPLGADFEAFVICQRCADDRGMALQQRAIAGRMLLEEAR